MFASMNAGIRSFQNGFNMGEGSVLTDTRQTIAPLLNIAVTALLPVVGQPIAI
jgi:hypothetical protein